MIDLNLSQNFAIIALNAQDTIQMTAAKKATLRCLVAAAVLELYLDRKIPMEQNNLVISQENASRISATLYQQTTLNALLGNHNVISKTLPALLSDVTKLSKPQLKTVECAFSDSLKCSDALEEIPSLLGCDLDFETAGLSLREYRSNMDLYTRLSESLRAELLEEGEVTDDAICMLWLLRESSCLYDLFSNDEIKRLAEKMSILYESNPLARQLFSMEIHKTLETACKNFLKTKKDIFSTPMGTGIAFSFPFLQRSQAIFIDTEAWFSNSADRFLDVITRLEKNGHSYQVMRKGEVPLIKIDNFYYELVPHARSGKIPIQGVRLRKYPIY